MDKGRAFQCQQMAEEVRAMIPDMKDEHTRVTLEKIAAGYDQLARVQESLAKEARPSAKAKTSNRRHELHFGIALEATTFPKKPDAMSEQGRQQAPQTLGDVLFAKPGTSIPEQVWAKLVQSVAAGDQHALHALYEMAHRLVFTLAMRITANPQTAEELTIDVFHDIWRGASRYDPSKATVLGWIMNQARSRAIDRLRFDSRKKRNNGGEMPAHDEATADPNDVLALHDQEAALRAALVALTPDERQAIELTFFAGYTHVEAATRLNQPLGTIKSRIRSALHKLRHALAAESGNF
jgi:RNA polymerase sigma-70 factor (ECF subfamily)